MKKKTHQSCEHLNMFIFFNICSNKHMLVYVSMFHWRCCAAVTLVISRNFQKVRVQFCHFAYFTESQRPFSHSPPLHSAPSGAAASSLLVCLFDLSGARSWEDGRLQLELCLVNAMRRPAVEKGGQTLLGVLIQSDGKQHNNKFLHIFVKRHCPECAGLQCSASLDPKSLGLPATVTLAERNSPYPVGETCSPLAGFSQSLSFGDHNEACTRLQMVFKGRRKEQSLNRKQSCPQTGC